MNSVLLTAIAAGGLMGTAHAQVAPFCIDWSVDGAGATLVNGQQLTDSAGGVFTFAALFEMETFGSNLGATVFDTDPAGPNSGGPDTDLLVDRGNVIMLQNNSSPTQTVPGIFDVPNDATGGGNGYDINFLGDAQLVSIELADINGGNDVDIVITDTNGLTRTYDVPSDWTGDPDNGFDGFGVLDLTILSDQFAGGPGNPAATASEDAGFDPNSIDGMSITFAGSGGWTNLKFVPTPGTAAMLGLGGLFAARRRR
ncbi:MAG: hypothetical protein AAGK04_10210 [Planctomycetota bacterium]